MKQRLLIICLAVVLSMTSIPQIALTLTAAENDVATETVATDSTAETTAAENFLEEEQMVYATNTNSVTVSGTCGDHAIWNITEDGVLTISGSGAMRDYVYSSDVPWSEYKQNIVTVVIEERITSIGNKAFDECSALTSIEIPSSVTSIGTHTFWDCDALTSIELPNSVMSIGFAAFARCDALTSIEIPNSVTSIGKFAFSDCSALTSIEIPNSVTSIEGYTFDGCSALTSIEIPSSVTSIGTHTFRNCKALTIYGYEDSDAELCAILDKIPFVNVAVTGISLNKTSTTLNIGANEILTVTIYPEYAINKNVTWTSSDTSVAAVDSNGLVTTVAPGMATITVTTDEGGKTASCNVTVAIASGTCGDNAIWHLTEDGVLTISGSGAMGDYDFSSDVPWSEYTENIVIVAIEEGITSIGGSAFSGCRTLTSIEIPASVTSIGDSAFYNCSSLTSISIPDGVKAIEARTFYECSNLVSVSLGSNVESIGNFAFYWCQKLKSINFPVSIKTIGNSAFLCCQAIDGLVELPNVESIGENAFWYCSSIDNFTLSNKLTDIQDGTFMYCYDINLMVIPDSVTSIGPRVFVGSGLSEVVFGTGIVSIGKDAFKDCKSVSKIVIKDLGKWCEISFSNGYSNPMNLQNAVYINDKQLIDRLVIPEGVERINSYAFGNCDEFSTLILSDTVKEIETEAFVFCRSLKNIVLGENVSSISSKAFYNCCNISAVALNKKLSKIGDEAFRGSTVINVWYEGENKSDIVNNPFSYSTWNYNIDIIDGHVYQYLCSTKCEICGTTRNVDNHSYEYTMSKEPTLDVSGVLTGVCNTCKKTMTVELSKLNEVDYTYSEVKKPSYTETGTGRYTWNTTTYGSFSFDVTLDKLSDENAPQIVALDAKGFAGETVTVTVNLKNNPGFAGLNAYITYSDDLTLIEVTNMIADLTFTNDATMVWDAAADYSEDSELLKLTFSISEDAEVGEHFIKVHFIEAYTAELDEVTFATVDGIVEVVDFTYGDANGDNEINTKDIILIRRHVAAKNPTTGESTVEAKTGADANGDGVVNTKDIILVRRYVAAKNPVTGESSVVLGPNK